MNTLLSLTAPLIIGATGLYALLHKIDVFSAVVDGASDGLKTVARMLPALVALLSAVYMLRASGALEALTELCTPVLGFFGIPSETAALLFLRPVTGSGALAVGSEIINQYGPDSELGRIASVMLGSTETTFYVIAVYFGAAGIKRSRHAIPAALCADFAGFFMASLTVRLLWFR